MLVTVGSRVQSRVALWPAALFVTAVSAHLVFLLIRSPFYQVTQYLLMPPLIAFLLLNCRSVRSRIVQFALLALLLSWLGDGLPFLVPKPWELPLRLTFYLPVGVLWILAYWPYRQRSILLTRPQLMAPFSIALVGLISVCVQGAGPLWPLLALYGLQLGFVAALSTGLNGVSTWSAVLMIASAGVMAVQMFNPDFAIIQGDFIAMVLYLTSQALFTLGILDANHWGRGRRTLSRRRLAYESTSGVEHAHR